MVADSCFLGSMRVSALLLLSAWFAFATALTFSKIRSSLTSYIHPEYSDFFPFPANKSSLFGQSTQAPQKFNLRSGAIAPRSEVPRKFIEDSCDSGQKFRIIKAWDDTKLLAKAQTDLIDGYGYDITHTQWLGKDWNTAGSWAPFSHDYRGLIWGQLRPP
jgi:hypothetical protein